MNPYAVRQGDKVIADLTYQNAEEQVRLYGAAWVDFDSAQIAIAEARAAQRKQVTVDAGTIR